MATAVLVKTVVFDQDIYRRGGMANNWLAHMTSQFGGHARRYAPARTGRLREQISTETHQLGVRQIEGTIASNAPYTMFVLRGTTGPIRSDMAWQFGIGEGKSWNRDPVTGRIVGVKGFYMGPMEPWGGFDRVFADEVSGQDANNFLLKAWLATARNHTSIRGRVPPSLVSG